MESTDRGSENPGLGRVPAQEIKICIECPILREENRVLRERMQKMETENAALLGDLLFLQEELEVTTEPVSFSSDESATEAEPAVPVHEQTDLFMSLKSVTHDAEEQTTARSDDQIYFGDGKVISKTFLKDVQQTEYFQTRVNQICEHILGDDLHLFSSSGETALGGSRKLKEYFKHAILDQKLSAHATTEAFPAGNGDIKASVLLQNMKPCKKVAATNESVKAALRRATSGARLKITGGVTLTGLPGRGHKM